MEGFLNNIVKLTFKYKYAKKFSYVKFNVKTRKYCLFISVSVKWSGVFDTPFSVEFELSAALSNGNKPPILNLIAVCTELDR